MAQVESTAEVDVERAARGEWLSWTRMSDFSESAPPVMTLADGPYVIDQQWPAPARLRLGLFTTQIGYAPGRASAPPPPTQLAAPPPSTRILRPPPGCPPVPDLGRLRVGRVGLEARARTTSPCGDPRVDPRRGAYHGCSLGALSLTPGHARRSAAAG